MRTIWGIHAGKTGDADSLFFKAKVIALGWPDMGDLSKLPSDRDAFKNQVAAVYPHKKPGAVPNNAGQMFRFVHEMKNGDLVVYASKRDRHIHIGEVSGEYLYNLKEEPAYPHLRSVNWLKDFPRTKFTQGALYEIGSAMSLFKVKNYAEEFENALKGEGASLAEVKEDKTISAVAENIEDSTRDFIFKQLAQELKGHPFAEFVAHLLDVMGYRTRLSPEGPDGGIDIIAHKDELGLEPPIIKVQVKSSEGSIGDPIVSALIGKLSSGEYGMIVVLGNFTPQARAFARNRSNIRLIDGNDIIELILRHYDKLDSKYKSILPLKRVFVPEVIEEE